MKAYSPIRRSGNASWYNQCKRRVALQLQGSAEADDMEGEMTC